jgi:hypothetical protein
MLFVGRALPWFRIQFPAPESGHGGGTAPKIEVHSAIGSAISTSGPSREAEWKSREAEWRWRGPFRRFLLYDSKIVRHCARQHGVSGAVDQLQH